MSGQTTALVTGANKGIGYEIAAGLGALGAPSAGTSASAPGTSNAARPLSPSCARAEPTPSASRSM